MFSLFLNKDRISQIREMYHRHTIMNTNYKSYTEYTE